MSRPLRQREVLERVLLAADGEVGGDFGDPVETVIPVVAGKPAVGLEEAGRHAGPLCGAKEGLGLGRLRVGVHDQGAMAEGTASFGGSRQSSTCAVAGRQGRSTAGGGAMSMPASRARFQSSKAGRGSGLAARAR